MSKSRAALILVVSLIGLLGLCSTCLVIGLASYLARQAAPATPLAEDLFTNTPAFSPTRTYPAPSFTPRPTWTATQVRVASPTSIAPITTVTSTPISAATSTAPLIVTTTPSPTIGPISFDAWCVPWHTESSRAQFKQVVDAVTISVEIENQPYVVRYIGLSPPGDSGLPDIQALAEQANRELVEGQDLLLIKDRSETDSEGRLLRYVIAGGVFVNLDLVKNGYAQVSVVPPDTSCDYLLREAAATALANQRGIWSSTPTPTRPLVFHPTATVVTTGQVIISFIQPEGSGWLDPDEFVEFNNISGYPIQMQGWRLRDLKGHTFVFPEFILYGGNYCRIYTNAYRPEHCGLSFYSLSPIWDNRQDCAYLYDRDGYLVDEYCYGW